MSDGLKLIRAICEQAAINVLRETYEGLMVGTHEVDAYQFTRQHFRRYSELPTPDTIAAEIGKRLPAANENSQYYFDRCHNRRMFNEVREPFNQLREALMANQPEDVISLISSMQRSAGRHDAGQRLMLMGDLNSQLVEAYNDAAEVRSLSGVTTGWDTLDQATDGYQAGDLIFYVARPKVGKSNMMIHGVRTAWQAGHSVLLISMEMTMLRMSQRFHAQNAGVDPEALQRGRLSSRALRAYRDSRREVESDGNLHMYSGRQTRNTTTTVDDLIQEVNPDIVFIDSFYKLRAAQAPRNTNRIEAVGYVTNELKDIALERRRPIVCTTQFNRQSGFKGKGGTEDTVAFSDAILQDASLLISIKMPSWEQTDRPRYRVLEVMEGREGERAKFAINFNFTPADFSEAPSNIQQMMLETPDGTSTGRLPVADVNYMR